MAEWGMRQADLGIVRKGDQDCLDAVVCAIIGYHWRFAPRAASIMIGDLALGYMVTPATDEVRERLERAARALGVPVDGA